ncbi:MAG TPA: dihydrodipicolinate synthase family protein [Ramlibacter sp.]
MRVTDIPTDSLAVLREGACIPAHLLALDADRKLDERRQRAMTRYYLDAGAGGVAVGVHSTQFAIRDVGLYEPVLQLAMRTALDWVPLGGRRPLFMIAGLAGTTQQAVREAGIARGLGYHAGLLSLGAMKGASEDELVAHCRAVAQEFPLVGFYLQPAVGGIHLPASFWRKFAAIDNVVAIKMAPFHRYRTLDVIRGVVDAHAEDRVTLYTGNDDHIVLDLLALDAQVTDCNAALFDVAHDFHGCIAGCHEILRRQGLLEGTWCLDPGEGLSPGQAEQLSRVQRDYPHLTDDAFVAGHRERWLA